MFRVVLRLMAGLAVSWAVCGAVIGILAAGSAAAQDENPSGTTEVNKTEPVSLDRLTRPTDVLKAFSLTNITEVAAELGFRSEVVAVEDEYPLVVLRDENNAPFVVQPMVCTGNTPRDTCHGLLFFVTLQGFARFPGITLSQVNRFNDIQFYARGHVTPGPRAILSRLVLSDYGTSRGNLAVELHSFRSAVYNYANYLSRLRLADGSGNGDRSGAGPVNALVASGPGTGRHFSGAMERSAELPRLIELWEKAGILSDTEFPSDGPVSFERLPQGGSHE